MQKKFRHTVNDLFLPDMLDGEGDIIPIISDGDDRDLENVEVPDVIPVLSLRNTVLFPGVVLPISIGRPRSIQLIKDAYRTDKIVGTVAQKDPDLENPGFSDLHQVGTIGQIVKLLEMPDGSTTAIIQGRKRMVLSELISDDPYFIAKVKSIPEKKSEKQSKDFDAIVGSLKDLSLKIIKINPNISPEATFAIKNIENNTYLINFICSNTDIKVQDKQKLLEINNIRDRGFMLLEFLVQEIQVLELKNELQSKVKSDLDQQQREFLLHQQMKTIQNELGGNPVEKEIEEYNKKAENKKWNADVRKIFDKELDKLHRLNPAAAEYSVQVNYIQTLLDLPWGEYTPDNLDLNNARQVLDDDHFGLDDVKERILEHLAVLKLKGDLKSPILCLYGPPGVGKTSLGKSVARALGRKYIRMSLGGLHDEAEIRGHRKTYIGAMPGRIIQNIKRAASSNPVYILDEIDKVGQDFRGDPSSALLEVLDPEKIVRVTAKNIASGTKYQPSLSEKMLTEILGPQKYTRDIYSGNDQAGVVTGLAWTAAGGEILFVETSISKGSGKLTLTGNLGEVMKESAVLALEYLKANADMLNLPENFSEKWNVHIHVPEGAIPKDGPSAGVTMATSIASAFTQRKVKKYLAMTGEITLRGKVLPVGGIKEKILAAKRANIKEITLSEENRKDVEDIKEIYISGLKFHYVNTIMDVLELALLKQKVSNAKKISFE
ncbi:MAG: endopeptidase La [Bacteroidetes bacterium]|nr:endopeptidase La [Bacteroidota bacterium]